ncbi:MAG: 2-octaprenyl-6-methoxyphenyl hydroxylase [Woeseiaceae bacterium]
MTATDQTDFDIVIAGGGMIGSSLAVALEPLGFRVAVVEPVARAGREHPSFDERSTALSRSSQRTFEAMGLWPRIVASATPIHSIHVSEKGRFGFSHIDRQEQRVEALGYVVINRVLGDVLGDAMSKQDGLSLFCPARIVAIERKDDRMTAVVESASGEKRLHCRLLVAADGAGSAVREMMGISASRTDYGQSAVIGNVLTEIPLRNRAFERFTSEGPLAVLPIADERAAFIWILPQERARDVMGLGDAEFTRSLQQSFGLRLGEFSRVGERAAYPLALTRANGLVSPRGVLIGNAAHGLHPVAAQGFNLGMRDVAALCDCLLESKLSGEAGDADPGSDAVLQTYAAWRRGDQRKVVQFTDGLVRLFANRTPPVRLLRNAGMLGFDLVPGVRSLFARHTMGLAGRLPRLSRGVPLK